MNAILKLLMFLLTAAVMPALSGLLPISLLPAEKRRFPGIFMAGYLSSFALFELVGLPILLYTTFGDFALLCRIFTITDAALIAAGIIRCHRTGGIRLPRILASCVPGGQRRSGRILQEQSEAVETNQRVIEGKISPEAAGYWAIFSVLLVFQMYKAYTTASFDGDDAYYVAQSLQTWETGTMYYYVPYTGYTTPLDGRHAMAMMPMWIAYIAKICGTHPTIVTHSMMPIILIPIADICFYNAACRITEGEPGERREKELPAFMVILAVLQIFGNISIYTTQTFLLMRTWQGKTVFANLILPAAVTALFGIFQSGRKELHFYWALIVILNLASGFCTSLAPALLSGYLMISVLAGSVVWKKRSLLLRMVAACIPNLLYLLLLLRVSGIPFAMRWLSFLKGGRLP